MRNPWLRVHILLIGFLQLTSVSGVAQTTFASTSAAAAGLGGAGRAAVEPIDVHLMNPAAIVHTREKDLHATSHKDFWLIGMTDNSPDNVVAGGLSYSRMHVGTGLSRMENRDLRLTLGGFVSSKLAMGLTAHQMEIRQDDATFYQSNANLGFSYVVGSALGFGAVFYDLMSSSLEEGDPAAPQRQIAVAAHGLVNEVIGLRMDVLSAPQNDFGKPKIMLGYESYLAEFILFRLGWNHDVLNGQEVGSVGFGLNLPRFRLNYAYQTGIRGGFDPRHFIDLGVPF